LVSLTEMEIDQIKSECQFWKALNKKKKNMLSILQNGENFIRHVSYVLADLSENYQRVELRIEPTSNPNITVC